MKKENSKLTNNNLTLSIKEAATLLGFSLRKTYEIVKEGEKIGIITKLKNGKYKFNLDLTILKKL